MADAAFVRADETSVFPRELDRPMPLIERARGAWLYDVEGSAILDAVSGGAMVTSLGHGVEEIIEAYDQAKNVSFLYNQQFTTPPQEELARKLMELAPPGFTRVHFTSGGAEANETALRLLRAYHVENGEPERWRIVSPAQAYHGPTMATFSLTGRKGLYHPFEPYFPDQHHIPPSTWRFDPTGEEALDALDEILESVGEEVAAFYCEPVSAAALPGYSPPERFWRGLAERREKYGFLIGLDEVVTGMGRTGTWFAAHQLPFEPDVITTAKVLGAGSIAVGGMMCSERVYRAVAEGSRVFEAGHTWDGAPLPCSVGLAVISYLQRHDLVERVRERGPVLLEDLRSALDGCEMVREVRGRGFLFGIDYVDPRDGESLLPAGLRVHRRIDDEALCRGLSLYSTQPTSDGYAGDMTLMAPPFVSTESDLDALVDRVADTVRTVEIQVKSELAGEPQTPSASVPGAQGLG